MSQTGAQPISRQGESTARFSGSAETRPPLLSIGREGGQAGGKGPWLVVGREVRREEKTTSLAQCARMRARPPACSTTDSDRSDADARRTLVSFRTFLLPVASRAYALARTPGDAA